jgi:murein DD-endopeptidase MepM/ murein hydrolase activator NlpD
MRWLVVALCSSGVAGCTQPTPEPVYATPPPPDPLVAAPAPPDPTRAGTVVDRSSDFAFDGGRIEFEMRRDGDRVIEIARNHFAIAIVMQWEFADLYNLDPITPTSGVTVLPPANAPNAEGAAVVLTTLSVVDPAGAYHRQLRLHARFGDPRARPQPYAYRLPFDTGQTYSILQGFHGAFSHRFSNEYAVDFDCPVATHVLAARPGVVVASNAAAQGSGTTPEYLEYRRTNFVLVLHDDGTLGEYMHLAPSGIEVRPGQKVVRGTELALSGNTGYSSTPHLHFQVMTAGDDGISARSFPFQLAAEPGRVEEPVQGRTYAGWE